MSPAEFILVHYHEISLKGRNRPRFIRLLADNLLQATADLGVTRAQRLPGRIVLHPGSETSWDAIATRVARVCGVSNFSRVLRSPLDLEAIKTTLAEEVARHPFTSFRVTAKRGFKAFPLTSQELNREVGAFIQARTGARVDLEHPELIAYIEILPREALCYVGKLKGPGGLPVGMSGVVVALLSGGIDSPVAAFRMMKRGCRVIFVHFHSHPFLSRASQDKARELVARLTQYQYRSRLYLVPFGELQRQVVLSVRAPYRVIAYRRFMARIAERIARLQGATALVTGESLGQVASQTLHNLAVIEGAVELPVLRPLIGMDKEEITAQAQAIGTFAVSILPDEDCCQLFTPRDPAVRSTLEELEKAESVLDVDGLVAAALKGAELQEFAFPPGVLGPAAASLPASPTSAPAPVPPGP
ncbi:MAG: tRNA 4-thiouridine(8) synthase ThiI [Deltaproteobacteria bacterium]|nr:tRNA 4-thiouridine(8) synthase ThiI [Deltaproteobacteria bacterium]